MNSVAYVLQLIRSHYHADERGFASAGLALARNSKSPTLRRQIEAMIEAGASSVRRASAAKNNQMHALPPAPIAGGMLQPLKPTTFADLLLPPEVQALFDDLVEELEYRDELKERGLRPRSRILLHGPPGNGKTSSACAMAAAIDVPAFGVDLTRVIGMHIGETGTNLGQVFASLNQDTLVVLDEIDAIGSARGSTDSPGSKEQNSTVNTLLTLLDRNDAGIIVATTNRADILDPALIRRFDERLVIPAPTLEQMILLAQRLCDQFRVPVVNVDDCSNFDEVSKRVLREARKHVMREIRASEMEAISGEEEAAE